MKFEMNIATSPANIAGDPAWRQDSHQSHTILPSSLILFYVILYHEGTKLPGPLPEGCVSER